MWIKIPGTEVEYWQNVQTISTFTLRRLTNNGAKTCDVTLSLDVRIKSFYHDTAYGIVINNANERDIVLNYIKALYKFTQ